MSKTTMTTPKAIVPEVHPKETVRCLFFPEVGEPQDIFLTITDRHLDIKEKLGLNTMLTYLPDGDLVVLSLTTTVTKGKPVNRRVGKFEIRGPFIISAVDAICDHVSLTEPQVQSYMKLGAEPLDLGATRQVQVADIRVSYRVVEVPARCPNCSADLTREQAVVTWSYSEEGDLSRLPATGADREGYDQLGVLIPERKFPAHPGEGLIKNCSVSCVACKETLAEGKVKLE